jgi:hypothetical protein
VWVTIEKQDTFGSLCWYTGFLLLSWFIWVYGISVIATASFILNNFAHFLVCSFYLWIWGLNSGVFHESLCQPCFVKGLTNHLPGLSSNHDPPDLFLLSSRDYRCEPLAPSFFLFLGWWWIDWGTRCEKSFSIRQVPDTNILWPHQAFFPILWKSHLPCPRNCSFCEISDYILRCCMWNILSRLLAPFPHESNRVLLEKPGAGSA